MFFVSNLVFSNRKRSFFTATRASEEPIAFFLEQFNRNNFPNPKTERASGINIFRLFLSVFQLWDKIYVISLAGVPSLLWPIPGREKLGRRTFGISILIYLNLLTWDGDGVRGGRLLALADTFSFIFNYS